ALAGMALIILTVAPLASKVVQRWSQRDVELRSRLVFNSIRDQVATGLASSDGTNLVGFFDRIAEDERLLALGFCSEAGQLLHATKRWPPSVDCASVARNKNDTLATVFDARRRHHAGSVARLVAGRSLRACRYAAWDRAHDARRRPATDQLGNAAVAARLPVRPPRG